MVRLVDEPRLKRWGKSLLRMTRPASSMTASVNGCDLESSKASSFQGRRESKNEKDEDDGSEEAIDQIIVDNLLVDLPHGATRSPSRGASSLDEDRQHPGQGQGGGPATGAVSVIGGEGYQTTVPDGSHPGDYGNINGARPSRIRRCLANNPVWIFCRWRFAPVIMRFFNLKFLDPERERLFQKEKWYTQKRISIACSAFFVLIWALGDAVAPRPWSTYDSYAYTGIVGFFTLLPIPLLFLEAPVKYPIVWQIVLLGDTWVWAWVSTLEMYLCGWFTSTPTCGTNTFGYNSFYATSLSVLSLFGLGMSRFSDLLGITAYIVLLAAAILPVRTTAFRSLIVFTFFHIFILFLHFMQEKGERKMFSMRDRLKTQYKATQKAQILEKKSVDSKKRFISYVFHEVRVPLNTALLAVQNLDGEGAFDHLPEGQDEMLDALRGCLRMMEKVLNDVLDFDRMEGGKFAYATKPFDFHASVRTIMLAISVASQARDLTLSVELDPAIDKLVAERGQVSGDDLRFRQVLSNLASNACKFTQAGGEVKIVTKLISPVETKRRSTSSDRSEKGMVHDHSREHTESETTAIELASSTMLVDNSREGNKAVIRVEVHDTGAGICARDMMENRLFSPYVQTEIGRRQGGKGSGLGLALVRHIVKLSKGRLGVRSRLGEGSCFWVELAFALPPAKVKGKDDEMTLPPRPAPLQHLSSAGTLVGAAPVVTLNPLGPTEQVEMVNAVVSDVLNHNQLRSTDSVEPSAAETKGKVSEKSAAPASVDRAKDQALNIFVVDDDMLTRLLMTRMLTRLGHRVSCAENGEIALRKIAEREAAWRSKREEGLPVPEEDLQFSVVFLDNQMPFKNGVEVVSELRDLGYNDLYVCGVTGNALKEDQEEYLDAGANQVLTKPVFEADLKRAIKEGYDFSQSRLSRLATTTTTS